MKYMLVVLILSNYGNFETLNIPAVSNNCTSELAVIAALNKAYEAQGRRYVAWCEIHYKEVINP